MDILDEIVEYKKREIALRKDSIPQTELMSRCADCIQCPVSSMKTALTDKSYGIIAEMKRRSPSKGWINEAADAAVVPAEYQNNGAAAISILTDEHFFSGANEYVRVARRSGVTLPILYKNFILDEYQLYEARLYGASAVLLIAACLSLSACEELIGKAHGLGLEVLLELHDEKELSYTELHPDMFGVNNRNLGSFVTSVENSFRMAGMLPHGACLVSESGISSPDTVAELIDAGYNGFLIGETFMSTSSPGVSLSLFIDEVESILQLKGNV